MKELSIDVETYSSNDLKQHGLYKYVEADDFEILMLTYHFEGEDFVTVDLLSGQQPPKRFMDALTDPNWLKTAHNAVFEMLTIQRHFDIVLDPMQWCCTMVKATMLGLPASLADVASVLKLDAQKDKMGMKCINTFSVPIKPSKANGFVTRYYPKDNPELWEKYLSYNNQDVRVEVAIREKLAFFQIPHMERRLWAHDRKLNDRGIRIDIPFVKRAIEMRDATQSRILQETKVLTGIENPKSPKQVLQWINDRFGTDYVSLNKSQIPKILEDNDEDELIVKVIKNRGQYSKTSLSKFDRMLDIVLRDGCVRGIIQLYGAGRTGRYSGKHLQPHNFTKSYSIFDFDTAKRHAQTLDLDAFEYLYGDVLGALSQMMRSCLIAREGHVFQVSDLSAIEARVLAWLAGEQWVLDAFAAGQDIYVVTASRMFDIPYDTIVDEKGRVLDDVARTKGKVAVLSLGYQGSVGAMIQLGALRMGICDEALRIGKEEYKAGVTEEVKTKRGVKIKLKYPRWDDSARIKACTPVLLPLVKSYRSANPEIVAYWYMLEEEIKKCVRTKKEVQLTRGMRAYYEKGILFIQLPSGRCLSYFHAQVVWHTSLTDELGERTGGKIVLNLKSQEIQTRSGVKPIRQVSANEEIYWGGKWCFHSGFKEVICYLGKDDDKNWGHVFTYGGKLAENITQAVARDVLCTQMLRMEDAGLDAVLHVHDEVVIETPENGVNLDAVNDLLTKPIPWADGLPLAAKGFISTYYKKD